MINQKINYSKSGKTNYLIIVVMCFALISFSQIQLTAQCPSTTYQDDGIGCTDDVFNNSTGLWDHIANNQVCSDGNPNNGIEICICNLGCIQGPLPVKLIEFIGTVQSDEVQLAWSTEEELNNMGFEVQKSTYGINWITIGYVEANETENEFNEYQFHDKTPDAGVNYYRLKQIDLDGVYEYSKVIAAEYNNPVSSIAVFPNPSIGLINLQINNPTNQKMKITISDHLGKRIWESELIEIEPNLRQALEIKENGFYWITVQIGDKIYFERVVVTDHY